MRKHVSIRIQRVFYRLRNFCGFWRLRFGLFGAAIFMTIAAPPNTLVAQFPGVGSEAPSGVATTADNYVSSNAAPADTSITDADNSGISDNAPNGVSDVPGQSNYDGGSSVYRSFDSDIPTSNLKKEHRRKQLFIEKLRLEFAAIELVERKTGLPFSRSDVPRYLDELRSDLKTIVIEAENSKITEGALKSIARDAHLIKTQLNDHLDQLLEQAGQSVSRKPFFTITPALPKAKLTSDAEIDALSFKFELAEYAEKVLQAMGAKRY